MPDQTRAEKEMLLHPQLKSCLESLYARAVEQGYEYITVDQFVLQALKIDSFRRCLAGYEIDPGRLKGSLEHFVAELTSRRPASSRDSFPRMTVDLRDLVSFLFRSRSEAGAQPMKPEHLIGALLAIPRAMATGLLSESGLKAERLRASDAEIADAFAESTEFAAAAVELIPPLGVGGDEAGDDVAPKFSPLENGVPQDAEVGAREDAFEEPTSFVWADSKGIFPEFREKGPDEGEIIDEAIAHRAKTIDLGESVDGGVVEEDAGKLIGRSDELMAIVRILLRKEKNNPLLIGEAGVGKTALIKHLMAPGKVDPNDPLSVARGRFRWHRLKPARLYSTDAAFDGLGDDLAKLLEDDDHHPVLIIDNLGELMGSPSGSRGGDELAQLLMTVFGEDRLRVLAACSYKDHHSMQERFQALMRPFQTVDIKEPSEEQTLRILEEMRPVYEAYHEVRFSDESLKHILACAGRFEMNRCNPEKSVDILDEAGSYARLHQGGEGVIGITAEIVETVSRQRARIDSSQNASLDPISNLGKTLAKSIFNQDRAIAELVKTLKISFSELNDSKRMRGCFLFVGPTGVGKTELTKQLALAMNMPLHRYDMSEFSERHSASRLIGAPPGYVGFESGGQLLSDVRKAPHSVILLDELEKAHADVLNLLLQMMDYGTLTSSSGSRANFQHCILVATCNVGATEVARNRPGFIKSDGATEHKQQLQKSFQPEFINRFDSIVYFNPLRISDLAPIVARLCGQLNASLEDRGLRLEIGEAVIEWLCAEAYDSKLGARPLERLFQEIIKLPIAERVGESKSLAPGRIVARLGKDGRPRLSWPRRRRGSRAVAKSAD